MHTKLGPLTVIDWEDSASLVGSTWNAVDEVRKSRPIVCKSVGWLAAEDRNCVVLVAHISGDDVGGDLCIPKSSIVKRRILR